VIFEKIGKAQLFGKLLSGGGSISAPLQRRESSVDLVDRKSCRIEVVTHPVQEFFALLVLRIVLH